MKRILCLSVLLLGVACSEDEAQESEIPTTATPTVTEPGGTATATVLQATPTGTATEGTPTKTVGPTPTITPTPTMEPTPTESFFYYSEIVEKNGEVIAEYGNESLVDAVFHIEDNLLIYEGNKFIVFISVPVEFEPGQYGCSDFSYLESAPSIFLSYQPENIEWVGGQTLCTEEVIGSIDVFQSNPFLEVDLEITATGSPGEYDGESVVTVKARFSAGIVLE